MEFNVWKKDPILKDEQLKAPDGKWELRKVNQHTSETWAYFYAPGSFIGSHIGCFANAAEAKLGVAMYRYWVTDEIKQPAQFLRDNGFVKENIGDPTRYVLEVDDNPSSRKTVTCSSYGDGAINIIYETSTATRWWNVASMPKILWEQAKPALSPATREGVPDWKLKVVVAASIAIARLNTHGVSGMKKPLTDEEVEPMIDGLYKKYVAFVGEQQEAEMTSPSL